MTGEAETGKQATTGTAAGTAAIQVRCSFCTKPSAEVAKVIAGPACTPATSASTCATPSS